jgi:hypothetical protein
MVASTRGPLQTLLKTLHQDLLKKLRNSKTVKGTQSPKTKLKPFGILLNLNQAGKLKKKE